MTNTTDAILQCLSCGRDFLLTAGGREWFEKKGLTLPKRCPACRKARREAAAATYRIADAVGSK